MALVNQFQKGQSLMQIGIITCGMPAFFYKWFSGAHSSKALKTIFRMCGMKNAATKVFGMVSPSSTNKQRFTNYISKAQKMGENL